MKKKAPFGLISLLIVAVVAFAAAVYFIWPKSNSYIFKNDFPQKAVLAQSVIPQNVSMIAVGDIMLSRTVGQKIQKYGVDYPFQNISAYLHSADLVFANLECPITAGPEVKASEMSFHANPGAEQGLKNGGVTVVSLANNHVPNYGAKGISDTVSYLDAVGLKHAGAGKNLADAEAPTYFEAKGIKFAMLAYNDHDVVPDSYGASANHAGTNLMDTAKLAGDVSAARQNADIVIVSIHSGHEYHAGPDQSQIDFAHAAIDAGAELVIGTHPHVIQTKEVYKGKYIFYSLGNFIFDQVLSDQVKIGLTLKMTFNKRGLQNIEYHPVAIENLSQPKLIENPGQIAAAIARLGK